MEMAENAVRKSLGFRANLKPQTTQATVTDTGDSRREIANKPYDDEAILSYLKWKLMTATQKKVAS